MQALRCDRCGKFYVKGSNYLNIKGSNYTLTLVKTFDTKQRPMDFCDDCKNSFAAWFKWMGEDCDDAKD